jgi:hypothetical protein
LSITARAKRREAAHSKITQAASTVATPSMEVCEQFGSAKKSRRQKDEREKRRKRRAQI